MTPICHGCGQPLTLVVVLHRNGKKRGNYGTGVTLAWDGRQWVFGYGVEHYWQLKWSARTEVQCENRRCQCPIPLDELVINYEFPSRSSRIALTDAGYLSRIV